jgi:SAM-dependent methyltransferase
VRTATRDRQLRYSDLEPRSLDETIRRRKASKIIAVLAHFLGRRRLDGLRVLDVGCSAGFICDELAASGARVTGVDIDVPGLRRASARFAATARFVCADGLALPFPDASVDVVVLNHIYEHVVDADAVIAEVRRVLAPDGVAYLGLGNRLGLMEPHHRLPLLSWLPPRLADGYLRLTGRGRHYYERYRTRRGLRRMLTGLAVWDYTLAVLAAPELFHADGELPAPLRRLPAGLLGAALRLTLPLVPTYLWVATPGPVRPAGPPLAVSPGPVPPSAPRPRSVAVPAVPSPAVPSPAVPPPAASSPAVPPPAVPSATAPAWTAPPRAGSARTASAPAVPPRAVR